MSRLIVHHAYLVNWLLALHWHRECTAAVNKVLPTCAAASDTRAVTPVEVAAAPPGGLLPRLLLPLMRRIVLLQWGLLFTSAAVVWGKYTENTL